MTGPGGVPPGGPASGSNPLAEMVSGFRPGSPESQTALMFLRYMHEHGMLSPGQHIKMFFCFLFVFWIYLILI